MYLAPLFLISFSIWADDRLAETENASRAANDKARVFYQGLWAQPGTPEREKSGLLLEEWIEKAAKSSKPSEGYGERDQLITKNVLKMTADYLKSGKSCRDDQKVRLYRAVSKRQLDSAQGRHLTTWSPYTYNYVMHGQTIPSDKLESHRPDPFEDLKNKTVGEKKNFVWTEITENHTGNGSGTSPLLSATLEWSVAKRWADPYILVMNVCPERALAVYHSPDGVNATFSEAEVYLPFFALPEEIVGVLEVPGGDPFYKPPKEILTNPTPITKAMRKAFFGKDLPFDVIYLTKIAPRIHLTDAGKPAQEAYLDNFNSDDFYNLIADRYANASESDEKWRERAIRQVTSRKTDDLAACKYAFNQYMKSNVYKQGVRPVKKYSFPGGQKINGAKFDKDEFNKVFRMQSEWTARFPGVTSVHPDFLKFNEGLIKFSEYFDNFESYNILKQNAALGYLDRCAN